jgi:hypothetical protein
VTNTSTGIIAGNGGLLVAGNGELPGAFGISGSTSATVDNSGVIFGTSVAIVGAAVDVTNRANGLIQSVGSPGSAAISAAIGGVTVTVRNAGVIKGTGSVGGDGIQIDGVGNITNTASGLITGTGTGIFNEDGIFADGFTTVDNAGTISGTDGDSFGIFTNGAANINNTGIISATGTGTAVHGSNLAVTNSGTISAPGGSGVVAGFNLELTNKAGGLITADHSGAGANLVASIANSGTITVTGQGAAGNDLAAAIFGSDVTVNNTASGVISATGPGGGPSGTAAINVNSAHVTNDGRIEGTNAVDSFGILLGSGTITNNRTGIISGANAIGEFGAGNGKGITIVNAGTIASTQGPNGVAIVLNQAADTLTLKSTSRIIGKIDFGDLAGLGNDVLNIDSGNVVINAKVSSLTSRVSVDDVLANVINFSGKVNVTGNTAVDAGGLPFVVGGNQVAVLDPTALSQEDRTLLDFTGGVSSAVTGRVNGSAANSSGMTAMSYAADDDAPSALGYGRAMADARAQMLTKAPAANWNAAPITVWSSGFGGVRNQDAGDVTLASRSTVAGAIIGIDRRIRPDWLVGLIAGGGTGTLSVSQNSQKVDTDYVFAGAYSRFEWGAQFLDLTLQGGGTHNVSARTVLNDVGLETARASYNGWFVSPEIAYGYRLNVGNGYVLTPMARLRYLAGLLDGYSETGSAETLSVGSRRLSNFEERGELELSHTTSFFGGDHVLKVIVHGGVIGLQRAGAGNVSAILIGQGLTFATPGGNTAGGVFGVAFDYRMSGNASLFGGIEATALADSSRTAAARGGLRVAF